ncbi:MAG: 6-phosphogluconolactonase [Phycisphaerales bacterium JB040]
MADPYELERVPEAPSLPGQVVLRETEDDLHDALCADLMLQAGNCVREFGDFHLIVSPELPCERVIRRLMTDPHYRALPWTRTRVWVSDDTTDGEGLASIAELLIGHSGLPPEQLHGFGGDDPESGVASYRDLLHEMLGWREKGQDRPDFALLTLNEHARVAGLDPDWAGADEDAGLALAGPGGRMSVSPRLVNACRYVAVLAVGSDAQAPLTDERAGHGIEPTGGVLRWFVDHAACGHPVGFPGRGGVS